MAKLEEASKGSIRVLHVLESTLGGTLRYLENIATATAGTQILSGLAYGSSRADSRLEPFLARAHSLGWSTYPVDMGRELNLTQDLSAFFRLRKVIRQFHPDILHCHSSKAGGLGRLAALLQGASLTRLYSPHALAAPLGSKYLKMEQLLAKQTDGFIAVSESEHAEIVGFSLAAPENVSVVSPLIDTDYFAPTDRMTARHSLGWSPNPHVLAIGRLTVQKNPFGFLQTMQKLHTNDPSVRGVWLGAGELEASFLQQIASLQLTSVVRLVPWQHDVRSYLAATDVLLSTSAFESFGYMVAEALAMAIPVVASDVTGTRDIMQGGLARWLYPAGDYDRSTELVVELLGSPAMAHAVGQLGRAEITREFSAERMRYSLIESYRKAISRRFRHDQVPHDHTGAATEDALSTITK